MPSASHNDLFGNLCPTPFSFCHNFHTFLYNCVHFRAFSSIFEHAALPVVVILQTKNTTKTLCKQTINKLIINNLNKMKKFFADNVKTIAIVAMVAAVVFGYLYYKNRNAVALPETATGEEAK